MDTKPPAPSTSPPSASDRLDSWKEIATHLGRSLSTVQRWERQEGLPVRRHLHSKSGSVYAFRSEIDAWWLTRGKELRQRPEDFAAGERAQVSAPPPEEPEPAGDTEPQGLRRRPWAWALAGLALAAAVGIAGWLALSDPGDSARAKREAAAAFERGLYFLNRRQAGGCTRAEPYLRQAVTLDPRHARALAALAFCHGFDRLEGAMPAAEAAKVGREEARRALELDPRLADGHLALGLIQHRLDYDWAAAEKSFQRAFELDPRNVPVLAFYGELLYLTGRSDRGLALFRSAQAVAPFHLDHNSGFGVCLLCLGKLDEAAAQFRRTLELDAEWHTARYWLADTLLEQGRRDEAVAEYLEYARRRLQPAREAELVRSLQQVYRSRGWDDFWRAELRLAEEDAARPSSVWIAPARTRPYYLARRYARLGDRDRALASLEAARAERAYMVVFVEADPAFATLRGDRRFADFVRRVGLHPRPVP